jgi:peptide/nickel transport system permease protein
MGQYVLKRLLLIVPVLVLISILTFTFMRILPGDVVDVMYADSPLSEQQIKQIKHQLGMDKPLAVQYWSWIGGIVRLNAGDSLWTRRPVLKEIADRLPITIELAILAFIIQLLIGIPVGMLAATHQDGPLDQVSRFLAILFAAAPQFWIATIVIVFFASYFGWIPPLGGVASFWSNPLTNLQQFFLPALILGIGSAAILVRYMRNQMLEVLRQDYVRTGYAKGLSSTRVNYVHALKNALIPIVTVAGSHLGYLLGGTVIIEDIFSLPGVGQLTLDAIQHRDIPQLQINVLFLAAVFLFVNLLVDLSYGWLDPRIRYS